MKKKYSLVLSFVSATFCLQSIASPFIQKDQIAQSIDIKLPASEYTLLATKKEQGKWLAFINNKWLRKGQSINELTIIDIQSFKVTLSDGQTIFLGNKSIESATSTTEVKNEK